MKFYFNNRRCEMKILFSIFALVIFNLSLLKGFEIDDIDWYYICLDTTIGKTIFPKDNSKYNLFPVSNEFVKAEIFYLRKVKRFDVKITLKDINNKQYDSVSIISYKDLLKLAKKVQMHRKLNNYGKPIGNTKPILYFIDDGVYKEFIKEVPNFIPLSIQSYTAKRDKLASIQFVYMSSLNFRDLTSLKSLDDFQGGPYLSTGWAIHLPIMERPDLFFRVGFKYDHGVSISTFNILFHHALHLPDSPVRILFGLGFGNTNFSNIGSYEITASKSYAVGSVGLNLLKDWVDIIFTVPITNNQKTYHNDVIYKIKLSEFEINLCLIL